MAHEPGSDSIAVEGEVVELFTRDGHRLARIVIAPQIVCEVSADAFRDAHLGDRVIVTGRVTIERVSVVAPGNAV